jgi:folate-dependent phosphoribosylglycinamide formyltransferase PurN
MRISMLTFHQEPYGLRVLDLLRRNEIAVEQVVVCRDVWRSRVRWLRRIARRLGWPGALAYMAWRVRSRAVHQDTASLERDYRKLANRVDYTPTPRSPATAEALARARPALCLLGDCGIVPPSVLAIPSIATVNAHPGILPEYRGLDTALWAVHENRLDKVGCTLHLVDPGIDTGGILETRPYAWRGDETIDLLDRRLTETCATMLAEACRADWPAYRDRARPQGDGRYYSVMPMRRWFEVERRLARLAKSRR